MFSLKSFSKGTQGENLQDQLFSALEPNLLSVSLKHLYNLVSRQLISTSIFSIHPLSPLPNVLYTANHQHNQLTFSENIMPIPTSRSCVLDLSLMKMFFAFLLLVCLLELSAQGGIVCSSTFNSSPGMGTWLYVSVEFGIYHHCHTLILYFNPYLCMCCFSPPCFEGTSHA